MLLTKPKRRGREELKQEADLMMVDVDVIKQAFKMASEKLTMVLSLVFLSQIYV